MVSPAQGDYGQWKNPLRGPHGKGTGKFWVGGLGAAV